MLDGSTMLPGGRRVVMFTPLPPKRNGIADYAAELLEQLRSSCQVTAVVEDGAFDARAPDGVEVLQLHEYLARADSLAEAVHVYQVGNNPDHVYMLPLLAERPGVLVLHDPSLHHLADCATLGSGQREAYAAVLRHEYGAAGDLLARQFARHGLREARIWLDLPLIRGLVGPSRTVIVHSGYAAARVLAQVPDADVHIVPHHFAAPDLAEIEPRDVVRDRLGCRDGELLFLSLGFVTRAKRVDLALHALATIRDRIPPFRYVIAGELRPDEIDVEALARQLGIADRVDALGYVAEEDFFSLIGAADVVVNLRHPIAGETSGTMIRALGLGAPLVVVDRGPFAEIPDGAAVKVPWSTTVEADLAAALLQISNDEAHRRRVGAAARAVTLRDNAPEVTAAGYLRAIDAAVLAPDRRWATMVSGWEALPPAELARLGRESRALRAPLWVRAGTLLRPSNGCRALVIGDQRAATWLEAALGNPPRIVAAVDGPQGPEARRGFDVALLAAEAAELAGRLRPLLVRLNAALALGGQLVVGLERADATAPPLPGRGEMVRLLEACGFTLEAACAGDLPELGMPDRSDAPAIEERCWRATKVSEFVLSLSETAMPASGRDIAA